MHRFQTAGALAALAFLLPSPASADIGLGPRLAVVRGDTVAGSSGDRYTGGVLRARVSPRTALELALDWRAVVNQSLNERTRDYPIQGTLLLYPVRASLSPYLLGGIGWYSQRVESLDAASTVLDSTTTRKFGYHAGFGGELRLGRRAAVHVDYRYTFIRFGADQVTAEPADTASGGLRIPVVASLAEKLKLSHEGSMWTGGLTVYF
ncbi:MAG: outer membrane beta-barrel protein [Acidobacteria bacterium]|nr:outer membrane beta-barrel protein [Acidobacteriota bacterium]